jgi:hypothetical protein
MSCPDWRLLVAAREAAISVSISSSAISDTAPEADPPGWSEARRHAAQCSRCREAALAADPLLLFARLPERTVTPADIGDMQSAVAALVRASRVGQADPQPATTERLHFGKRASGLLSLLTATRVAAALGVCSLLALSGVPRSSSSARSALDESAAFDRLQGMPALDSAVEELDRPGARIYELPQPDMAVVMIVDASLDV